MHIYHVYLKEEMGVKDDSLRLVKDGFSFYAALFNILWAIYNRAWIVAGAGFAVIFLLTTLESESLISEQTAGAIRIGMYVIFGFCSSEIMEFSLKRCKYNLVDTVIAPSEIEAEMRFLERQETTQR